MNQYFDMNDTVYDITEKYPQLIPYLVNLGFTPLSNEIMRKTVAKTIRLEMALKTKHIDLTTCEKQMVSVIENGLDLTENSTDTKQHAYRIAGLIPCPNRQAVMDALEQFVKENSQDISLDLHPASQGHDWLVEEIKAGKFADAYLCAGYDGLFTAGDLLPYFKNNTYTAVSHSLNSVYENVQPTVMNEDVTMIGGVPAVISVNLKQLKELRIPQSWLDLLRPEYEGKVSFPVSDVDMFDCILLGFSKKYGLEKTALLGKSLLEDLHPASVVKKQNSVSAPAISIVPYFFATLMKDNKDVKIIWPIDGAILNPLFLTVRSDKQEQLKQLTTYICGKDFGEVFSTGGKFSVTSKEVNEEDHHIIWCGYDVLFEGKASTLLAQAKEAFFSKGEKA